MQNSAAWISTTPEGYRVRVRFLPMNAQETERTQRLLRNMTVQVVMVTGEGPLSVDLYFTDKEGLPAPPPSVDSATMPVVAQAPDPLTAEQQAAMDKPASKA
jgi:hypothetical protein